MFQNREFVRDEGFGLLDGMLGENAAKIVARKPTVVFGLSLMNARLDEAADKIVQRSCLGYRTTVNFVNAHCINVASNDQDYRSILNSTSLLLPDGSGMRLAARMAGQIMTGNLNGTDLFPELCRRAAERGLSIYLLGGEPGVAAAAAIAMQQRYPGLRVAGSRDGFFAEADTQAILNAINGSGADLLFVGMGVPRQEKWIARHRKDLTASTVLGVGGLFDFYSGRIARAPMAFRRIGCEWVWRLAQEPQRLAHRYLVGNLTFMVRAWLASREAGAARQDAIKRLFDVIGAGLILALTWPVVVIAMIAIRLDSKGPAFFRQVRVGENGRPFTMWKFRSMVADADARRADLLAHSDRDATCFKMKGDPRVTRVGRFIRRCSIDELPQLFNVLRGDMSLVGPRPALPVEAVTYRNNHWARLKGKPGITCTWQVGGRAEIAFEDQVELDIAYLRNHHLAGDIALLARTIPAVLVARGAY